MKYDTSKAVCDLDGKPMEDVTYKHVLFLVLTTSLPEDGKLMLDTRMRLFDLAQKVNGGGEIELSAEDVVLIKGRAGSIIADVVTLGRLVQFLEAA